jgi:purine-nucleoside phosphorylase
VPFHLRPSAPTAADALICGDPARALAIAQHVLVQPRMSNHNRGLWGYYGETPAGHALTVQATGIGAPSAAVVIGEVVELGVRRLIRIGTCAAGEGFPLGAAAVVASARAHDGVSTLLGAGAEAQPDPGLTAALVAATGAGAAAVTSSDLLPGHGDLAPPASPGLHDLQTAAVLGVAARLKVPAAAVLVVRSAGGRRLEDDPLESALLRLADGAVSAFGQPIAEVEG